MTGNFDINKELLDAMRIIARQEIEKCNRDITKIARVIAVNTDKTVKIEMDGKQYDNIPNYNGTTLSVNNIVKVTYPQGQASNMYVSGGGENEIYSNLGNISDDINPLKSNYVSHINVNVLNKVNLVLWDVNTADTPFKTGNTVYGNGFCITYSSGEQWLCQLAMAVGDSHLFTRHQREGVWSGWTTIGSPSS